MWEGRRQGRGGVESGCEGGRLSEIVVLRVACTCAALPRPAMRMSGESEFAPSNGFALTW